MAHSRSRASTLHVLEAAIPEFFGTFLFTVFGMAASSAASGVGLNGAFGNGIALTTILYMLSNDEGSGKLNAAISLAVFLTGQTSISKFFTELAMQFAGGVAGGAFIKALVPSPKSTCFVPAASNTALFAWELLGTFVLIGVVFSTSGRKYRTTAPLAIGLALFTAAQAAGPYTGGCFNPVRYLANIGVGCSVRKGGYYIGAELLAAVAVVFVHYIQQWVSNEEGIRQHDPQLGVDMSAPLVSKRASERYP